VKLTGDGVLATFDGPGRAAQCALNLRSALDAEGITTRAGLHTCEIEIRGDDIAGLGVHVVSRVMSRAGAGEILTSSTVRDLVVGLELRFEDRGDHNLKGVPRPWRLFALNS
jgi:class 3 adenylate cyclase